MVYGSVCSGVEAASVAWEPLGFVPAWFSEIDAFPSAVLKHRFSNVPNLGDMTQLYDKEQFNTSSIDVLVGGTPCQSFSIAGLRKGLDDPRGNLTLEFLRIIERKQPRWIVWENVPGVLSDRTNAFGNFIYGLQELGYGVCWRVLDAQYFGVPQRRKRVFVIGYLGDWRPSYAVLFEQGGVSWNTPKSGKKGEEASEAAGRGVDKTSWPSKVAPTLMCHYAKKQGTDNQHINNGAGLFVTYDTTQLISSVNSQNRKPGDPCHTLSKSGDSPLLVDVASLGHTKSNGVGVGNYNIASTLEKTSSSNQSVITNKARRLTPVECERLQGFPDGWTNIPWKKGFAPDSLRYQAMGNSMAVPVMRWIGRRIKLVNEIITNLK